MKTESKSAKTCGPARYSGQSQKQSGDTFRASKRVCKGARPKKCLNRNPHTSNVESENIASRKPNSVTGNSKTGDSDCRLPPSNPITFHDAKTNQTSGSSDSETDKNSDNDNESPQQSVNQNETKAITEKERANMKKMIKMMKMTKRLLPKAVEVPSFKKMIATGEKVNFVIDNPIVYKVNTPVGSTHICFGVIRIEEKKEPQLIKAAKKLEGNGIVQNQVNSTPEEPEEEVCDVDTTGLEKKDIDLVMQQANVSENKAAKALLENENDVVNAIMALTM